MSASAPLKVVLCWHMHQPQYCNLLNEEYQLPWTYLHAIKDYVDMAAHLEAVPGARAVVNFAPILLEQIADYADQVRDFLADGRRIRDPLLAALAEPALPVATEQRMVLVRDCLRAHRERMIGRFPCYQKLAEMAEFFEEHPDGMAYLSDQYLEDLLVWYHLAWMAETVRRDDDRIRHLQEKGFGFTLKDRHELLRVIGELVSGVLPRYRALADGGQVELAMNPYAHPILPLLLDMRCALEAMPEAPLPNLEGYPDGAGRARWHLEQGRAIFQRHFGREPTGCWPSEGAVSGPTLALLEEYGFGWAATGESVLRNSLTAERGEAAGEAEHVMYQPYRLTEGQVACFFRDDGLSDLIGFTYSDWHADDAVANFVHHLENIARVEAGKPGRLVPVILDGENAWEHYPENGFYFLRALYERLVEHPDLELSTFSDVLAETGEVEALGQLVAGSWVYGTLSTWIGDKDKNRGWEMLGDAKRAFDHASGSLDPARLDKAGRQLAVCEGSDWFWWFGDYNPEDTVSDFERLYRLHLTNLYALLSLDPPEYLAHSFTHGSGRPEHGGTMRHGKMKG